MQKPLNKKLVNALNNVLVIATNKLNRAKERNDSWGVKHYQGDIAFINKQLKP